MYDAKPGEELTAAERELEGALRSLSPAASAINRDRLIFNAGEAIGRRSLNVWRGMAATLVVILGLSLVVRQGGGQIVREIVYVDRVVDRSVSNPTAAPTRLTFASAQRTTDVDVFPISGESNYLVLRDRALRWGVAAAIPLTSGIARPERPLRLDELLDMPSQEPPASRPAERVFPNGPVPGEHL